MRSIQRGTVLLAALILAGCTAYPVPTRELARSEAAIAVALEAGAAEVAAVDLESAQEKVKLARRWIAANDYQPARWLVEQGQVDAELAAMKAISARAMREASLQAGEFQQFNRKTALNAR
jgi:acyl-CoA synthetase (AMP-forming)/AMP-acid ligase II